MFLLQVSGSWALAWGIVVPSLSESSLFFLLNFCAILSLAAHDDCGLGFDRTEFSFGLADNADLLGDCSVQLPRGPEEAGAGVR